MTTVDVMKMISRSATLSTLVAVATTVALAGCTLAFTPELPDPPSLAPTSAPSPAAGDSGNDDGDEPDSPETIPSIRQEYSEQVQRSLSCPGDAITISDSGAVIELVDDCASVTVSGAGTVVLAQVVGTLTVTATSAIVIVASADSVTTEGTANLVRWESGSPVVIDTGVNNTIGAE